MKHLLRQLKDYKKETILAPLFKMLEALFDLFVPLVVARIINVGIGGNDRAYIIRQCLLLVALALIGLACSVTAQYFAARAATEGAAGLRRDLFGHIQKLDFQALDTIGTSTLITRITTDVTASQQGVNMFIRLASRAPFLVMGAIVMTFVIDWQLSLLFLAVAPLLGLVLWVVTRKTIPMYGRNQQKLDGISRHTGEDLVGVRVIRAFSRQKQEASAFQDECTDLERSMLSAGRIAALLDPMTFLLMDLGIVAVLWFGGGHVDTGRLSQGDLTAFANYMNQILLAGVQLANLIQILTKAQASSLRIAQVLETETSMQDGTSVPDPSAPEAIAFEDVSFGYAGSGDAALSHISFTLQKGQTLGIIGGTGSGKSTLVRLIDRSYDATEGRVRVFGQDVREMQERPLRRLIGSVPQKAVLFSGTVTENLRVADADASEETMRTALEIAQAAEIVDRLPFGMQTRLMQGGRDLSGGQKQRLTIARALAGRPAVLILDDSMSALDYATDAALRRALETRCEGMTKVIVSQRATSLMHADLILVLDDGVCVGQGTHEALLESCEVYREIYETQMA